MSQMKVNSLTLLYIKLEFRAFQGPRSSNKKDKKYENLEKNKVRSNLKAHHRFPREILRQNTMFHKNRTNNKDSIAKIVQRAHARPYNIYFF